MNTTPTDITANKHRGNSESQLAHRIRKKAATQMRDRVYAAIKDAGLNGLTAHELANRWRVPVNTISGRFSELKANYQIEKTGTRANADGMTCGVCVATVNMPNLNKR